MSVLFEYILPFLGLMAVLVAVHEGGHFLAARLLGIHVTDFAIGMGPTLWSRIDRKGCTWRLCLLPIGGYVRMLGDADAASAPDAAAVEELNETERRGSFRLRPIGHRALVAAAGPAANFAFGFLILAAVYGAWGHAVTPPVAAEIQPGSVAAEAGMRPGDRVLAVGGVAVDRFEAIIQAVGERAGQRTALTLERDGQRLDLTVTPRPTAVDGVGGPRTVGRIGVVAGPRVLEPLPPLAAARESVGDIYGMTVATLKAVGEMVMLERPLKDMGGPIKIAEVSGDALTKFGFIAFVALAAMISVNLGVMNLLPIPVLDGGHLLLYALEAARGRPAAPETVARLFKGGALALLFLFAAITGSDIGALIGRLLGP